MRVSILLHSSGSLPLIILRNVSSNGISQSTLSTAFQFIQKRNRSRELSQRLQVARCSPIVHETAACLGRKGIIGVCHALLAMMLLRDCWRTRCEFSMLWAAEIYLRTTITFKRPCLELTPPPLRRVVLPPCRSRTDPGPHRL